MRKNSYVLLVTTVIFGVFSLFNLVRVFFPFRLILGAYTFPVWGSALAFVAGSFVTGWCLRGFYDSRKSRSKQ